MAIHITGPKQIPACGHPPKIIHEYIGRVNSKTSAVSVAQMDSPAGWSELEKTPAFGEYTVVLEGTLRVTTRDDAFDVGPGQAVIAGKGEWIQYITPHEGGAKYVAICLPAFSPEAVHRDA